MLPFFMQLVDGILIAVDSKNFMATTLSLGTDWEEVKAKIKERNVELTDEDLDYQPGQEEALLERLSKKMNRSKEDVKGFIESISDNKGLAG